MQVVCIDLRREAFQAFHIIAPDKDIYMLSDISGLSEYAVSQTNMPSPERIESFTNGCEISVELYFRLAAGERFEIAAEMNCNWHFFSSLCALCVFA
jgi:hypothetical protein